MAMVLQKFIVVKVVGVSLVMLFAACSTDQRHKRQVSGDEAYLDAPALRALQAPEGIVLPLKSSDFDIRATPLAGAVGKQLDIRPPVQPLALLNGSRTEYSQSVSQLLVENSVQNRNMWLQVVSVIQDNNFPIANRHDVNQTLDTDWVKWPRADEEHPFEGRYQVSVQPQAYQLVLMVKSLGLQQMGKVVTDSAEIQRYSNTMLNTITNALDKIHTDSEYNQVAGKTGTLDVQSGSDDTGLPMLIVRSPYSTLWKHLPAALEKAGMKVTDSSRPQGTFSVSYTPLSNADWDKLGAKNPELQEGDYKLQVGDLDNRSSLQFIDPKGHTLTQVKNDALVAVFQAALNQADVKVK